MAQCKEQRVGVRDQCSVAHRWWWTGWRWTGWRWTRWRWTGRRWTRRRWTSRRGTSSSWRWVTNIWSGAWAWTWLRSALTQSTVKHIPNCTIHIVDIVSNLAQQPADILSQSARGPAPAQGIIEGQAIYLLLWTCRGTHLRCGRTENRARARGSGSTTWQQNVAVVTTKVCSLALMERFQAILPLSYCTCFYMCLIALASQKNKAGLMAGLELKLEVRSNSHW